MDVLVFPSPKFMNTHMTGSTYLVQKLWKTRSASDPSMQCA